MQLQVLVSTINQDDYSLLKKMNIKTNTVVVNQCQKNEETEFEFNNKKIKWISQFEKGVGLSRNTAIENAVCDIVLFADDDVVYCDDYENIVLTEFEKNPEVDMIVFNLKSLNTERPEYIIKKSKPIHFYNALRYGTFRFAVKTESLKKADLKFSRLFGGGAEYSAGEDNIFIIDALKNNFKIISSEKYIGVVEHKNSTWFNGYNKKYYFDKGCLFFKIFGKHSKIFLLLFEIKKLFSFKNKTETKEIGFFEKIKIEFEGSESFKNKYEKNNND